MKLYEVLLLVLLGQWTTVSAIRWPLSNEQSLDSDLDDMLCPSNQYSRTIIDIHASMERGAELLDGRWSADLASCSAGCCNTQGCDLALFKNEGASKSGKNCYYVHCGDFRNCVMVEHTAFTSVAFAQGERTGPKPNQRTGQRVSPTPPPTPASPPSTSPPPPATTHHAPSEAPPTVNPTHMVEHTTPPTSKQKGKKISGEDGKKKGLSGQAEEKPALSASEADEAAVEKEDGCGKYGCDGSGVVAVVVVGVICFVIVLVVVAILLKKVVDERRKRKFKNVDYLINGMYT